MKYKCIKKQPAWENIKVGEVYEGEIIDGLLKIDNASYYVKEGFFVAAEPEWLPNPMTGECPVPYGNDVEVRFLEGAMKRNQRPEVWRWARVANYRDWTAFNQQQTKPAPTKSDGSKYDVQINGAKADVYDVLQAFNVINPALQHLIKKALKVGQRGHKDEMTDYQDIIDSAIRAKQLASQGGE